MAANRNFALVIGALAIIGLLAFDHTILADPDTYWHLGAGRWIIDHGQIPTSDPFSNSFGGTRWVPHEWLTEVIFASLYQWLGWSGIVLVTIVCAGLSFGLLAYFVTRWLEPLYAVVVVGFAFALTAQHILARPHMLAMPFMILFIGGLVIARDRHAAPSLWLTLPMIAWANLHGAFTLGLGFAAYFALETFVEDGWRLGTKWLVFLGAVVGAALMTPNGIDGVLVLGNYFADQSYAMSIIKEWQSPDFQQFQPLEAWLLGFIVLSVSLGIRLPAMRALVLIGLLHLALVHMRNTELVGLLAPLVLLPAMAPQFYALLKREYHTTRIGHAIVIASLSFVAAAGIMIALHPIIRSTDKITPAAALAAARENGAAGPVFNSYVFGGYLIFSGISPFIDGRSEMYGDAFIKQYMGAETNNTVEQLAELFERYKIGWALVLPNTPINLKIAALPGWHKVFADDYSVVYLRSTTTAAD